MRHGIPDDTCLVLQESSRVDKLVSPGFRPVGPPQRSPPKGPGCPPANREACSGASRGLPAVDQKKGETPVSRFDDSISLRGVR